MNLTDLLDNFLKEQEELLSPDEVKPIHHYTEGSDGDFSLDFIGVGFSRSGTKFVSGLMSQHPEICFPKQKELHFFGNFSEYSKGSDALSKFFNCNNDKILGEFTPRYSIQDKALERIQASFDDVKIIVCLRDPVERAFSQYKWFKFDMGKEHQDFEDAIDGFLSEDYIKKSKYSDRLSKVFELFGRDRVHLIYFEDIVDKPDDVAKQLYNFLEVNDEFLPEEEDADRNAVKESKSKNKYYVKILRYENLARRLAVSLKINGLLRPLGKPAFDLLAKLLNSDREHTQKPKLDEETKSKIYENYFKEDILELEKMVERDISNWKR